MDNQSNQEFNKEEKNHTEHHGAHSGFRKGISDYNDGNHNSHYGGNDDIYASEHEKTEDFDGKVAWGNDNEVTEEEEEDFGKYHSGL